MVEHGARHLVFVNRSGVWKPQARESVQMLEAEGAAATFCGCDITDGLQTKEMLVTLARDAKPIRGVVQEAMLLRVGARSISLHHLVRFDLYAEVQTRSILLLLVCANWIPRIQDTYIERLTVDDYNAVVQGQTPRDMESPPLSPARFGFLRHAIIDQRNHRQRNSSSLCRRIQLHERL